MAQQAEAGKPAAPPLDVPGAGDEADGQLADEELLDAADPPPGSHPPPDEDTTCILTVLVNDHDRIKGLHKRFKDPTDTPRTRQLLAWQLLRELMTHTYAEEEVLYPVVAELVDEHMRDHALDEHESLKLFAADLEGMKIGDAGYEEKMRQLMEAFLEHTHEEEHKMLPALREVYGDVQLRELGKRFVASKTHLPTSPHPVDPKHPHSLLDDPAVLLDAARDAARFEGTPPPIGSPSTEVLRKAITAPK